MGSVAVVIVLCLQPLACKHGHWQFCVFAFIAGFTLEVADW